MEAALTHLPRSDEATKRLERRFAIDAAVMRRAKIGENDGLDSGIEEIDGALRHADIKVDPAYLDALDAPLPKPSEEVGGDTRVCRLVDNLRVRSRLEGKLKFFRITPEPMPTDEAPKQGVRRIVEPRGDDKIVIILNCLDCRRNMHRVLIDESALDVHDEEASRHDPRVTSSIHRAPSDERWSRAQMTRTDYYADENAPKPNSLVVAASVVVTDAEGRVLLLQRTDSGNWALPGGAMEIGESLPACAVREVREEAGLDIEITGLVGTYTDPKHVIAYADGEVRQQFNICFTGRIVGGRLAESAESTRVTVHRRRRLERLAHPPDAAFTARPLLHAKWNAVLRMIGLTRLLETSGLYHLALLTLSASEPCQHCKPRQRP